MLNQLRHAFAAPRKLRESHKFLESWCPQGVEVVVKDKACWLHYSGMIYSLPYAEIPDPAHVPFMLVHLENHKWCLKLAGGVYTHRSILEAWVRTYLPDASVIGFGANDIVYPEEQTDRPLLKGVHSSFAITHRKNFVLSTQTRNALALLAMNLRKKTEALTSGGNIYVRGNM